MVFSVVVILFSLVTVYPVEFPVVQPVKLPELIVWELIVFGSFYLLPLQFSTGLSRPLLLFTVGLIFFGVVK